MDILRRVQLYSGNVNNSLFYNSSLLGEYLGNIDSISGTSYLFARGGYHTGQVKGSSVLGDGTGYGTLSSAVTVPATNWTEPIIGKITPGGSGQDIILSGSVLGNDEFVLDVDANGFLRAYAYISTTISTITTYPVNLRDGQEHSFAVDYQSGNILLYVDGSLRDSNPVALNGNQTIVNIFRRAGGSSVYAGNLCDLKSALFDLPMLCVGSTVEYSATAGLPDCTWSNFAGAIYQEHTDGSGTNRANENGYSERENNIAAARVDLTTWAASSCTVTGTGPYTLDNGIGGTNRTIYYGISTLLTAEKNNISIRAKSGTLTTITLRVFDGVGEAGYVKADLAAGSIVSSGGAVLSNAQVTSDGDGFYIVSFAVDYTVRSTASASVYIYPDFYTAAAAGTVIAEHPMLTSGEDLQAYVVPGVTGRQPAGYQGLSTEYPGPIAPDKEITAGTTFPNLTVKGALGPKTQGLIEWTGEAQVDLSLLPFNTNDTTFIGTDGLVVYETAQDAETIALIQSRIGG